MIHITKHTEGRKMEGMQSINTNSLTNKFCISSAKKDMICKSCYSNRQLRMYDNMKEALQRNSILLSTTELKEAPFINANIFRFNSFGELINMTHFRNLCFIASKNPGTTFALWTKRFKLIQSYFTKNSKPDNLLLVHSSYRVNHKEELPEGFDKVFTVYDRWYASVNEVIINCQSHCSTCQLCYTRNNVHSINELKR